jgi:photosystem II stability/assembly factor-like uncharacterized protein
MNIRVVILLVYILSVSTYAQWVLQSSGTQLNLNSIFFIDSNTGWAVGDGGIILKTTNGGSNWITQSGGTTDNLYSVHFENSNVGWIVGEDVRILKSTNGGSSWAAQIANPPVPADLYSVHFQDLNNGWAIGNYMYSATGYDSYLINTTNGGTNWQNNFYFMDEKLFSVQFMNNNLGLVAGSEVARTSDGGTNWYSVFGSFGDEFYSLFFIDANTGWTAGKNFLQSKGLIYKSTDGGLSWLLSKSDSLKTYTSVFFADANHGWVSGFAGVIMNTTNGGINWSYQSSGISSNLNSIFFTDNLTGWAAGSNGIILKTNNGGTPVELISFTSTVIGNAVKLAWITATETNNSGFEILRFAQNDNEWEIIGFIPGFGTTTETKSYSYTDENIISGIYKYRLKQKDFDGTFTYSNEIEVEVDYTPKEFVLNQNYPNPFNPTTSIQYAISSRQFVTLKVYDVLGNEIAILVNEELPAGEYDVEFNTSSITHHPSSGIYFYRLKSGSFVETKKMVLLK